MCSSFQMSVLDIAPDGRGPENDDDVSLTLIVGYPFFKGLQRPSDACEVVCEAVADFVSCNTS